jgi:hypothetical protein
MGNWSFFEMTAKAFTFVENYYFNHQRYEKGIENRRF